MFTIIEHHMNKHHRGIRRARIDGQVPAPERQQLVKGFNEENKPSSPRVMLLSLLAGGAGLNLCAANHLYIIDLHW